MSTSRMESFSDGVLAVAITLLVLDITVPTATPHSSLGHELAQRWPNYAAYATSFMTIGIIWINHHAMVGRLREPDHPILILNIVLLLTIAVIPFATALMAAYLRLSAGQHLAAAVYSGTFLVMALAFAAMNRHILLRKAHLLRDPLAAERRRRILSRSIAGLIPYVLAVGLSPVSAYATLIICAGVAVFYAFPVAAGLGQ